MRSNINNFFYSYFFILIILVLLSALFIYSDSVSQNNSVSDDEISFQNDSFFWPTPGFHKITSYFGPRNAPTSGASSVHSGIDIGAVENTCIYAVLSCKVVSTGFQGAGGYTIVTQSNEYTISYCHVSPYFIVVPRSIC